MTLMSGIGALLSQVTVPFLLNPAVNNAMKSILYPATDIMWISLTGFWIAVYIRSTMKHIFVTLPHQLVLAALMSVIGDQLAYFLPESFSVFMYVDLTLKIFLFACMVLVAVHYLPERITNRVVQYSSFLARFIGPLIQVRSFFRVPSSLNLDDRILLVISILMLLWPQVVDLITRKLTKMRTPGCFGSWSLVMKQGIAGAVAFSMSRKSPVAQFLGMYPFHYSAFLLLPVLIILNFIA